MEAIFGVDKKFEMNLKDECPHCHGTGAKPGTQPQTCSKCGGKGQVVYTQQSLFGMVRNVQTCPDCHGSGKIIKDKCTDCGGTGYIRNKKTIEVSIPAGIDSGQSVRIRGKGEPGTNGGARGDLLVKLNNEQKELLRKFDDSLKGIRPQESKSEKAEEPKGKEGKKKKSFMDKVKEAFDDLDE